MTMRSETTPQPYKVWRIPFAFDDQPDVFKFRPVIFGGIGQGGVQLMLLSVKVTSHPPRQGIEGEIPLLDWQATPPRLVAVKRFWRLCRCWSANANMENYRKKTN